MNYFVLKHILCMYIMSVCFVVHRHGSSRQGARNYCECFRSLGKGYTVDDPVSQLSYIPVQHSHQARNGRLHVTEELQHVCHFFLCEGILCRLTIVSQGCHTNPGI